MPIDWNVVYWEAEQAQANQPPASDPNAGATPGNTPAPPPQQGGPILGATEPEPSPKPEPVTPEMPEDDEKPDNFDTWQKEFFKLAIKGDPQELIISVQKVRDLPNLEAPQQKFIEDNWQVLVLRQNANIDKASKEIRKMIKQSLDRNNPGSTVMQYLTQALETSNTPMLKEVFIKLTGLFGLKADLHRKFVAALLGAIQVGGGGNDEDLAYAEKDYSIRMYTRFASQFGEITLGKWNLQRDDPDRYLSEPELERLQDGSPEEKQVFRRRIVIESIAERFRHRAFLIHVTTPDGVTYPLGWDLSESILVGYKEGKLIVRSRDPETSEAMIDDDGNVVPLLDLVILYLKETNETNEFGRPKVKELPFMERKDGTLYLTATLETIRDVFSGGMPGCFFKEMPFNDNPAALASIRHAIPTIEEILMRRIR